MIKDTRKRITPRETRQNLIKTTSVSISAAVLSNGNIAIGTSVIKI